MPTFAVHARYRGTAKRRAALVKQSAEALSVLDGMAPFEVVDVEDIATTSTTPRAVVDTIMVLLSDGDWAVGVSFAHSAQLAKKQAADCLRKRAKAGVVQVNCQPFHGVTSSDIESVFVLAAFVLARRTPEGREATSYMRRGFTQVEAAEYLGITKQAMSQRLQAAGWQAENAAWQLAVHLLTRLAEG
ncbi:MarR family transcriptional regulator [Corynebacterium choanae]|uniref:DNA-binding protein n=1 Tax=Corynebacterium choanae TaxID=1862358 RepID=A0A3G6J748_9CORY|nr:MarR family transcriptional regulator [Corynebacterium choanae]AZA13593.1 hypothetical protein CCHOA_05970 [Corynebacterium choanae]